MLAAKWKSHSPNYSSSWFNIGSCMTVLKTEPYARLCFRSDDVGQIMWCFINVHSLSA